MRALQARLRFGLLLGGDAALVRAAFDHAGERLLDAGKTFVEKFLFLFEHHDVATCGGRDLRDARAHQPTTQYSNFFDFHVCVFSFICVYVFNARVVRFKSALAKIVIPNRL